MTHHRRFRGVRGPSIWVLAILVVGVAACAGDSTAPPGPATTALLSIAPQGGAVQVATTTNVTLTFNQPMMPGMETYVSLHRGMVSGPAVPMSAAWSPDRTQCVLTPTVPLDHHTAYALHVGGGMRDGNGNAIDMSRMRGMGGQPATGGMMGGMPGEMGPGWQGGSGGYGMVFTFTTD